MSPTSAHTAQCSWHSGLHHEFRSARTELGFTLVELVTVIVIVGILATVAGPRFFAERPFSDRGYADELAAALRNAQKIAVGSGCWVSVNVAPSSYQARQHRDQPNCGSLGPPWRQVTRSDGSVVEGYPPQGVTITGTSEFTFNGAGTLEAAAGSIQVGPYTVSVIAATGLVTVN